MRKIKVLAILMGFISVFFIFSIEGKAKNEGSLLTSKNSLFPSEESFPISNASGSQSFSKLVYNSTDNQYLVVWMDSREEGKTSAYGPRWVARMPDSPSAHSWWSL